MRRLLFENARGPFARERAFKEKHRLKYQKPSVRFAILFPVWLLLTSKAKIILSPNNSHDLKNTKWETLSMLSRTCLPTLALPRNAFVSLDLMLLVRYVIIIIRGMDRIKFQSAHKKTWVCCCPVNDSLPIKAW
jgi:hypothetical protein